MARPIQNKKDPHRVQVLIAGAKVAASAIKHDPDQYQRELLTARERFGGGICQCQPNPLQLVIRERKGRLFLACWPEQSQLHALDCPFFSRARESVISNYAQTAIAEEGPNTIIQLHHPLLQHTPRSRAQPRTPVERAESLSKLHVWGLLHLLWERGGLNRWHPGWKRDWGMVRSMLRRVSQSTMVEGDSLLKSLYVPPIWTNGRKESIKEFWDAFTQPLFRQHRGTEMAASGFVIGAVRKLDSTADGFQLRLSHHSEVFHLDKAVADRLAIYSRRGWAVLSNPPNAVDGKLPMVIAAVRVQATSRKALMVVEAALMRVTKHYIPVTSSYQEQLVDRLIVEDRRFIKPLHYDMQHQQLAHFVLTDCVSDDLRDTAEKRVALFVYGTAIAPTHQRVLETKDRAIAIELGCAFWKWDVYQSSTMPALPPKHISFSDSPTNRTQTSKE